MIKLFVRGLNSAITPLDLAAWFSPYGEVSSVFIPQDRHGKNMTYGFVTVPNEAAAEAAIVNLEGQIRKDCLLNVSLATTTSKTKSVTFKGEAKKVRLNKRPRISKTVL